MLLPKKPLFLTVFLLACCRFAGAQDVLKVDFSLSNSTVVLGEPVLLAVRITNISGKPLMLRGGGQAFGQEIRVQVPGATKGRLERKACGDWTPRAPAGSSGTGVPLAPGETGTERYLLQQVLDESERTIDQPGEYDVLLAIDVQFDWNRVSWSPGDVPLPYTHSAAATLKLKVLPADPARLKYRDAEMAKSIPTAYTPVEWYRNWDTVNALSWFPSPALEPMFRGWMRSDEHVGRGEWFFAARGLERVHTEKAHADLIEMAGATNKLQRFFAMTQLLQWADPADLECLRSWRTAMMTQCGVWRLMRLGELAAPKRSDF